MISAKKTRVPHCTTHHHACDCREAEFADLQKSYLQTVHSIQSVIEILKIQQVFLCRENLIQLLNEALFAKEN